MITKKDIERANEFMTKWEIEQRKRKTKAKEILYLLLNQHPNIMGINVYFDGCGDSGQVENIEYLSKNAVGIARNGDLDNAVEEYAYSILPVGWEVNDGSFGTIHIDVQARTAHCDFNRRTTKDASFTEE